MLTLKKLASVSLATLMLVGCSSSTPATTAEPEATETTVTESNDTVIVKDVHGEVEVPVNPEVVVSLDNRTFETLSDWGIELAAVPKDVMPADSPYVADESVQNIGNHREPNLEVIAAVQPDLVIVGQRFVSYYDEIKALVPDAVVIDFSFDVSEDAEDPGQNLVEGFTMVTETLGQIFSKEAEADALVSAFNGAIQDVQDAYNGTDTVMAVVVSGGEIGYSAPRSGRVWGPLFTLFDWVPALEIENGTSDHQGDDISVEAIAQSNPDWIFVLDRDAAISDSDSALAKDVIENSPALQNLTAVTEGHIVYAPDDTYTNESIQTYLELLGNVASALKGE